MRVTIEQVQEVIEGALARTPLTRDDQRRVAHALLDAECSGRKGHGINRLRAILEWAPTGGSERIAIDRDQGGTIALNGGGALGILVAHQAAAMACERLATQPIVAIGCRNCRHTNAIGYFAEIVARAGGVAIAATHCAPLLAPHDGRGPVYGTNPIALACPGPDGPLVADVSPARVTYGSLINAKLNGASIEPGAAIGPDGAPTTDPAQALKGAMLPIADHKGSALAFLVQVMAGALAGAAAVPGELDEFGFFLVAFRTDAFGNAHQFKEGMGELVRRIHEAGGTCPGEGSARRRADAKANGIEVDPGVWKAVLSLVADDSK